MKNSIIDICMGTLDNFNGMRTTKACLVDTFEDCRNDLDNIYFKNGEVLEVSLRNSGTELWFRVRINLGEKNEKMAV